MARDTWILPTLAILVLTLSFVVTENNIGGAATTSTIAGYTGDQEYFYGENILTASTTNNKLTITITPSTAPNNNFYVYKKAYYSENGEWKEINLTSIDNQDNTPPEWIRGWATANDITIPGIGDLYIAAYTCREYDSNDATLGTNKQQTLQNNFGSKQYGYLCGYNGINDNNWRILNVTTETTTPNPTPITCTTPPLNGKVVQWKSFWKTEFPAGGDKRFTVPRNGYSALKFNTSDKDLVGGILLIETTTAPGIRLGAINRCPGDFSVEPECKHVWGLGGGLIWGIVDIASPHRPICRLQKNTNYYLSFTFTDGVNPATSSCSTALCLVRIQSNAHGITNK